MSEPLSDEAMARHMLENQVEPQLFVQEMRDLGHEVDVVGVRVDAAEGFLVECYGCGRQARLPFQPPEGKAVLCPQCQRRMREEMA